MSLLKDLIAATAGNIGNALAAGSREDFSQPPLSARRPPASADAVDKAIETDPGERWRACIGTRTGSRQTVRALTRFVRRNRIDAQACALAVVAAAGDGPARHVDSNCAPVSTGL